VPKEIKLNNGLVALVDDDCYQMLSGHTWYLTNSGYAATSVAKSHVAMHRFIIGAKVGQMIDHLNNNPLDNRRENLAFTTSNRNNQNRCQAKKFPFIGVGFVEKKKMFSARMDVPKGKRLTKFFKTIEDAARQYDEWAIEHYGAGAMTNLKYLKKLLASLLKKK
jgi:hypothetical protein